MYHQMHFLIIVLRKLTLKNTVFKKFTDCEEFLGHNDNAIEWCDKCKSRKKSNTFL